MKMRDYILALALALVLAGCSKVEEIREPSSEEGNEIVLCVRREADDATRAALDGSSVKFQAGDRISVFDGNGTNCLFTQTGEIGADGSATFTGKVGAVADSYLVLYPYMPEVETDGSMVGTIGTDDVRRPITIPYEQKAVAGSFDPGAFISVARSVKKSNSVHSITFRNVCALVKFTIPESMGSYTFEKAELTASHPIAGCLRANPDGSSVWAGPGQSTITLSGTMKAGRSYYFCTDAKVIDELGIKLYHYPSDAEPVVEKSAAKKVSLTRNKVLDLGGIAPGTMPSKEAGWYGEGTAGNPYQISTVDDMNLLLERLADGENPRYRGLCYRMTDDIDCGGEALVEDGKQVEFCGVFDGNGHTLSDYLPSSVRWFSSFEHQNLALFHRVYRATFRNLTLEPSSEIKADLSSSSRVSFLVAETDEAASATLVENCRLKGSVNLGMNHPAWSTVIFGGFVGENSCDKLNFVNCTSDADIVIREYSHDEYDEDWHLLEYIMDQGAVYHIGGFVGHMYCGGKKATTSFDRCRNRGDIDFAHRMNAGDINCGGFIGHGDWAFLYASTFSFTNCVNSGDITVSVGSDNNWANVSGFVGINFIDGWNHCTSSSSAEQYIGEPRFYNCLNKGDISVIGKNARAAGFTCYYRETENEFDHGTDDSNQFAICVNIGNISASGNNSCKAAISSGHGTCHWCWWLEKDKANPVLNCNFKGLPTTVSDYPYYCYCYPTINADTPNNRRIGSDGKGGLAIVLDRSLGNSQWSNDEWIANTVPWIGGSRDRSLDLDF